MNTISYKISLNSGDLITCLPGIREMHKRTGKKAIIYQTIGREVKHPETDNHPIQNNNGMPVTMSMGMFLALKPLLEYQPYIERYEVYKGQPIDIDLDKPREYNLSIMPYAPLHFYSQMIFPEMAADLSDPWISTEVTSDKFINPTIIINRTERYNNPHLNFYFLKKYEDNLLIVGTDDECESFNKQWNLRSDSITYENLLYLATDLSICKFMVGNQSFVWHLANAIGVPRILEVCDRFPNTWPTTPGGYPVLFQDALEYYFDKLWNGCV